jgi:hypothetical protein
MLELGALDEVAAAAEKAGFDAISLTEHPIPGAAWLESGGHQSLDPFVALGFAAAATTRLRLMTNLVVARYRNPFLLAKAAATRRQGRGRRGGPARPAGLHLVLQRRPGRRRAGRGRRPAPGGVGGAGEDRRHLADHLAAVQLGRRDVRLHRGLRGHLPVLSPAERISAGGHMIGVRT